MTRIEVRALRNARERKLFLTFPWRIYHHDPLWVPPLVSDRAEAIDPQRGAFFQRGGRAQVFMAWEGDTPLGTICTGVDPFVNQSRAEPEALFGFFDCVARYEVAQALFDHARAWAAGQGMRSIWGPFNLDYENAYGILIEGRERPPAMLCGHTPPYYQDFVERYGFQPARADNIAFAISLDETNPQIERLHRLSERLRAKGRITIRGARFEAWEEEADHIHRLLNLCLVHLPDHIDWHRETVHAMLKPFLKIADPELILFAEVEGEVVGWFPAIPNVNEWLMHADGLRHPWDYLKLWWHSRRPTECVTVKSVLVLPEYWDRGVAVLLFAELARRVQGRGHSWADLSITSEDNPRTPQLAERFGAELYKRYRVYRIAC